MCRQAGLETTFGIRIVEPDFLPKHEVCWSVELTSKIGLTYGERVTPAPHWSIRFGQAPALNTSQYQVSGACKWIQLF
jgi:hypothetical protein